ncbi:N-acetyl-alpha-D-glucosaminyl L-malate synthase BshA [candidate division KSB1 bacterium]|nr:MAG: N-acetyl-alpha-D-glucosaminyl L-malate synthase BshA [candidate division KSB1 bacterium]
MNIGIVCYPTYGGSGVVATELGVALADRGHEVHFFSSARPFRLHGFRKNVFYHEVPVVHYALFEHTPYTLTISSTLHEAQQIYGLDVIHAHYAIPHAAAAYMAKQMGGGKPPVVTTLHGTDITLVGSHPAYAPVVKFTIDQSDRVTAVSQFLADATRERIGVTKPIRVIPNFVNGELYKRQGCTMKREHFAPCDVPIIAHVSNFRPVKRIPDLIAAFIKLRRRISCKLLLVGDGPERARAEMDAHRGGVLDDVMFLGNQADVHEILGVVDIYCLPSETESFGLSALEAMACEVPVVASRVGGLPEVVTDGKCGYLTEVGNTEELSQRLWELCSDRDLRRQMGKAARARALELFPIEKIVGQYEAVYEELL